MMSLIAACEIELLNDELLKSELAEFYSRLDRLTVFNQLTGCSYAKAATEDLHMSRIQQEQPGSSPGRPVSNQMHRIRYCGNFVG